MLSQTKSKPFRLYHNLSLIRTEKNGELTKKYLCVWGQCRQAHLPKRVKIFCKGIQINAEIILGKEEFKIIIDPIYLNQCLDVYLGDEIFYKDIKLKLINEITGHYKSTIVTMIKNYNHRVIEWINYNFKLGFEKIVLFDHNSKDNLVETIEKLNDDRIIIVPFNYTPFVGSWPTLQRIVFTIGLHLLSNCSRHVAVIDADEFIMIPNVPNMNINKFLDNYPKSIRIRDIKLSCEKEIAKKISKKIDNNVLDYCKFMQTYVVNRPTGIAKIINFTNYSNIKKQVFLQTPHKPILSIANCEYLQPSTIYFGHMKLILFGQNRSKILLPPSNEFINFKYNHNTLPAPVPIRMVQEVLKP
jgi:hypothetical protein